jgi:peptide/nickel transport system permease protein
MLAVAAGADLLASDWPIALRLRGNTYLLPAISRPLELRSLDLQALREQVRSNPSDWMIEPLIPFGPERTDITLERLPAPPGSAHLLGTDETGRDVLARLIHGTRASLAVGLCSVALYVAIGLLFGTLAGFCGGKVDLIVSRLVEVMLTFPTLFLVLCIMAMVQRPSLVHLTLVIGLTRWPDVARLVRGEVLRVRELDYIQAARALGASDARIVFKHILPNALGPVRVAAAMGVAGVVLLESALSFLGLGAPPPTASWGEILAEAQRNMVSPGAWWLALFPGAAIFLTVTAFNLAGEGLRDAFDPRLRGADGAAPIGKSKVDRWKLDANLQSR